MKRRPKRLLVRTTFVLAMVSTAIMLWFGVMTLRHEHPDVARNIDAIKGVAAAFVSTGFWIAFAAVTDRLPKGRPEQWNRGGWADGWDR